MSYQKPCPLQPWNLLQGPAQIPPSHWDCPLCPEFPPSPPRHSTSPNGTRQPPDIRQFSWRKKNVKKPPATSDNHWHRLSQIRITFTTIHRKHLWVLSFILEKTKYRQICSFNNIICLNILFKNLYKCKHSKLQWLLFKYSEKVKITEQSGTQTVSQSLLVSKLNLKLKRTNWPLQVNFMQVLCKLKFMKNKCHKTSS